MARLVDADEFERFLMNLPDEVLCEDCCYVVVNEMRKQPTIEAVPVKHGEWIEKYCSWYCSECGKSGYKGYIPAKPSDFCPNCGAKMNGGAE